MAPLPFSSSFFLFILLSFLHRGGHGAGTFRLDVHHKFSDPVKRWVAGMLGEGSLREEWPKVGSFEYYATLVHHDRVLLRGRGLEEKELTFSSGNATVRLNQLGFLHYATVSLGTPAKDFLVALDTGSDLFWVPCDCIQCAPTSSSSYGFTRVFQFNLYSPNTSSTGKEVPCKDVSCNAQSACSGDGVCPYKVEYLSANTSSSGFLVEDVMKLVTEDGKREVNARITFGCGRVQSGSFLDRAAPNGLFGLGMDNTSVPSLLSTLGLASNSFSMCFGSEGIGQIIFGDKGSIDQQETPFDLRKLHPTYNISITELHVGSHSIEASFNAIFDSGTSFTALADPAYTLLSRGFNSLTRQSRQSVSSESPFEYCYLLSPNDTALNAPSINLTMKGGSQFSVLDPLVFVSTPIMDVYCLAVIKSSKLNIIGQNFMTGKRIVFDREKFFLRWKDSNCNDTDDSAAVPVDLVNTTIVPSSYNPEAMRRNNGSHVTELPVPPIINHSSQCFSCFIPTHLLLILLSFIII